MVGTFCQQNCGSGKLWHRDEGKKNMEWRPSLIYTTRLTETIFGLNLKNLLKINFIMFKIDHLENIKWHLLACKKSRNIKQRHVFAHGDNYDFCSFLFLLGR